MQRKYSISRVMNSLTQLIRQSFPTILHILRLATDIIYLLPSTRTHSFLQVLRNPTRANRSATLSNVRQCGGCPYQLSPRRHRSQSLPSSNPRCRQSLELALRPSHEPESNHVSPRTSLSTSNWRLWRVYRRQPGSYARGNRVSRQATAGYHRSVSGESDCGLDDDGEMEECRRHD